LKIAIIIPAYNEEKYIKDCITSLLDQTYPASEILVVDDGSSDRTKSIIESLTEHYQNLHLTCKPKSFSHEPGGKIVKAFHHGLKHLKLDYDIICKFDADLIFPSDYLQTLIENFKLLDNLGMYGGFCSVYQNGSWKIEQLTNSDHLRGALKAYRKECFEDIDGLLPAMGWDTIDEMKARFKGWDVKTNSALVVKHLKPTGENYKKELPELFGVSLYRMRYSYTLALLTCLKMARKKADFSFFKVAMSAFQNAKTHPKENTFLVSKQEGAFIRAYRWRKIKQRLF
jgi:glycosyltransferase involved in cell wall biosynthesis